ncbi:hypothetical protein [Phascolarctobacterium succinatutens]|uniref:hypothetical protein n=1 Tax=Phascolarctobacterium succinatutens TaxID=626940 RepID=UPI003AF51EF8
MSIQFTPDTPATRQAFNRLAREKMKLRLLADIRMDLMVCELEGYSKLEYLDELLALVQELRKGGGERDNDKSKNAFGKHGRNRKHRCCYRKNRSKLMRTHKPAPGGRLLIV